MKQEEFKWDLQKTNERPIMDGDVRIVNLPVKVVFEWSDKIIADYDQETDTVLEYTSGYVMKVLADQSFVYKDEESIFIASSFSEKRSGYWTCVNCGIVPNEAVTFEETHEICGGKCH